MCFSSTASFIGGAVISAIGIVTIRKIHQPSHVLFATIPIFFGFQQIVEGLLWLALQKPGLDGLENVSTHIFLVMAQVIWPVMIPVSIMHMERSPRKRKILSVFLAIGIILACYYSYCLITFSVHPTIKGYHIQYDTEFPKSLAMVAFFFYIAATLPPLFISSIKRMYMFGLLMTFSCLVTGIFYTQYLTSVWCFFAALISAVIFWILSDAKKIFNLEKLKLLKI
jgi:hypothetical protein